MFLLDGEVVAELRHAKAGGADPQLAAWAGAIDRHKLFVSALTLIELDAGAARLARGDKAATAALRRWVAEIIPRAFEGRILAIDAAVVRRLASLPYADARNGLLAATAIEHGLTLATRDVAAFKGGRVKLLDPWRATPDAHDDDDWSQAGRTGTQWLKNLFVRA